MENISLNTIADYFISLSNETQSLITNLKLQKLVYYAQAWNLAINDKQLISEDFEAWVHGPVIPSLYVQYKEFGWKPIVREDLVEGSFKKIEDTLHDSTKKLLSDISDEYFGLNAFELERLTHEEDPWKITRGDLPEDAPSHKVIDKILMSEYYKQYV
ncbi:Panacea domain-containing protein [Flavobacterium sp.]|uniref:Panacea domain-containing protein n=1 Tax=Flavobacterium sp. TaxID=239 RepID=UPI00391A48C1